MKQKITYQPLTRPLSSKRLNAVQREFYPTTWRWSYVAIVLICAGAMSGGVAWQLFSTHTYIWIAIVAVTLIGFAIFVKLSWSREADIRTAYAMKKIRLEDFATENNLEYTQKTVQPGYSGIVFTSTINTPTAYDQFRLKEANGFEVGNYRFMADDVPGQEIPTGGYIHMKLERKVAHMLVSGVGWYQGALSRDIAFEGKQILGLEGDFYQYFSLYAPLGYERDALYIFTPDFMALLVDQAKHVMDTYEAVISIEVVDDDLYIYSRTFDFTNPRTWKMIIGLVSAIGPRTISRTDLYSDERVESRQSNVIAKAGRRLKREGPMFTVLAICLFIAVLAIYMYFVWDYRGRPS
jgi:hypothetical protein